MSRSRGARGRVQCGRGPAQHQREWQHRDQAKHADAGEGRAPADAVEEVLQHRRPQRTREVVAADADRHRDAASAREPRITSYNVCYTKLLRARFLVLERDRVDRQMCAGRVVGEGAHHLERVNDAERSYNFV